jgi:hypothetical protein
MLITTGGVSFGPHDHVRPALARLGYREAFAGVKRKPGRAADVRRRRRRHARLRAARQPVSSRGGASRRRRPGGCLRPANPEGLTLGSRGGRNTLMI